MNSEANHMSKPLNQEHIETRLDAALELIRAEALRAATKFPAFNSAHEGYGVLLEEVDELWDEVKGDAPDRAAEECVQVGAMAVRFLTDLGGAILDGAKRNTEAHRLRMALCRLTRHIRETTAGVAERSSVEGLSGEKLDDFLGIQKREMSKSLAEFVSRAAVDSTEVATDGWSYRSLELHCAKRAELLLAERALQ